MQILKNKKRPKQAKTPYRAPLKIVLLGGVSILEGALRALSDESCLLVLPFLGVSYNLKNTRPCPGTQTLQKSHVKGLLRTGLLRKVLVGFFCFFLSSQAGILLLFLSLLAGLSNACHDNPYDKRIDYLQSYLILNMFAASSDPISSLSEADYQAMSPDEKFRLVNKFYGTLFDGLAMDQQFDMQAGLYGRRLKAPYRTFVAPTRIRLRSPLSSEERAAAFAQVNTHNFRYEDERILAEIYYMPLSKDRYDAWMAYILTQTILFSPAYHLPSVKRADVLRVYGRLRAGIASDLSISEIAYEHMVSQENWRRFRSPEDNTREMMEIFLRHFNDDDVPLASIACQNWALNDAGDLAISEFYNTEPVEVMGQKIIRCEDFYYLLTNDPRLVETAVARLVAVFFPGAEPQIQERFTKAVLARHPRTWRDIFDLILFSRAYLLGSQRIMSIEERILNLMKRIHYTPSINFFRDLPYFQTQSGQAAFYYKLGRPNHLPADQLSMSYYHRLLRERIFLDRKYDAGNPYDGGWDKSITQNPMTGDVYLRYLFLSVIGREPRQTELATINDVLRSQGFESRRHRTQIARVLFDYFSMLPESYIHKPVLEGMPAIPEASLVNQFQNYK